MKYKAKKGDVIAICKKPCDIWTLGRAHRVTSKGLIDQFIFGNEGVFYSIDNSVRIAVIGDSDKRKAAERLLALQGGNPFNSADELKSAINAMQAF
jgi:DNA helicase TIP49 (TBP-interacting protein)